MNIIYDHTEILSNKQVKSTVIVEGLVKTLKDSSDYTHVKFKIEVSGGVPFGENHSIANIRISVMLPTFNWEFIADNINFNSVLLDFSGSKEYFEENIKTQLEYAYDLSIDFLKAVYNFE